MDKRRTYPQKRRVAVLALLRAGGGAAKVGGAALSRGAVDLELLRRVHLASAVARHRVGEPGTVPAGGASPEESVVDGLSARQITPVVVIAAVPD